MSPPAAAVLFHSKSKDEDARYLSNFAPASLLIGDDFAVPALRGRRAPNVEAAFQASKIVVAGGERVPLAERVRLAFELLQPDFPASEAKRRGGKGGFRRAGLTYDDARWSATAHAIMRQLLRYRMASDGRFRRLLAHNARLGLSHYHFERSGARSTWGGHFPRDGGAWRGQNALGRMLDELATMVAAPGYYDLFDVTRRLVRLPDTSL